MSNERRKDQRKSVSLEARWEGLSGKHNARITDISLGGCYLESLGHAALGEFVVFEVKMPQGEWLRLRGSVASCDPPVGFSLSFTYLTEDEEDLLAQLISA